MRTITIDLDEFQQLLRAELEPIITLLEKKWQQEMKPAALPKTDFMRNRQTALDLRANKQARRQLKTQGSNQ